MKIGKTSVKITIGDALSFMSLFATIVLSLASLKLSMITQRHSEQIDELNKLQDKNTLRSAAWKIYNGTDLLRQSNPDGSDNDYFKTELLELKTELESQLHNPVLVSDDTLQMEWENLLTDIYFYIKFYHKLGRPNVEYTDLPRHIAKLDSNASSLFRRALIVTFPEKHRIE